MKTMKIKCAQTGVERSVNVMLISSHELLQQGGYDYAVKFYTVEDEENDGELKWVTDEDEQMVLCLYLILNEYLCKFSETFRNMQDIYK